MYTCVWLLDSNPLLPTLVPPGNLPCPPLMEACPAGLPDAHHLFRLPSAQQLHHCRCVCIISGLPGPAAWLWISYVFFLPLQLPSPPFITQLWDGGGR